jgi:hypothetical protein
VLCRIIVGYSVGPSGVVSIAVVISRVTVSVVAVVVGMSVSIIVV